MKEAVIFPDPHNVSIIANRNGEIVQIPGTEFRAPVAPFAAWMEYYAQEDVNFGRLTVGFNVSIESTVIPIACYVKQNTTGTPDSEYMWVGHVEPYQIIAADYNPDKPVDDNWMQMQSWQFNIKRTTYVDAADILPIDDKFYVMYQVLHAAGVQAVECGYDHTDVRSVLPDCQAINVLVEYKGKPGMWNNVPEWTAPVSRYKAGDGVILTKDNKFEVDKEWLCRTIRAEIHDKTN